MAETPAGLDILPFSEVGAWAQVLDRVSGQPLSFCPGFPETAARHVAWWNCQPCGGPLLVASVNADSSQPNTKGLELLEQPEQWLENRLDQMGRQYWGGDSFPFIRADFGPVMMGGLLGGKVAFVSDTTWTRPFIKDDWSNAPGWTLPDDGQWWNLLPRVMQTLAQDAPGRYIACTPSLGGSADLLLNFRGSAHLCMDLIDQPEKITTAIAALYPAWRKAFCLLWETGLAQGAGLMNWVQMWSNLPYIVLECDFNYLIGPREFETLFLPDIRRQAATVGRAIFHLDGPGATRHIDALLDAPEIQAIQYVAGAGNKAMQKLPMLKKIQEHQRALQISCEAREVLPLARELRPEGLAFLAYDFNSPQEIDQMYKTLRKQFC